MNLNITFNHPDFSDDLIAESLTDVLDASWTLAMATVQNGMSYINTAHFAYNEWLELVIFTDPAAEHSRNLAINPSVAAAVWKQPQEWVTNLQGVQIFGQAVYASGVQLADAIHTYTSRYFGFSRLITTPADFEKGITPNRLYVIRPQRIKLLDETRFGRRNWLDLEPLPSLELWT